MHKELLQKFIIIFLTKANECDIIIKLSHESESQGNERAKERSEKTEREFGS